METRLNFSTILTNCGERGGGKTPVDTMFNNVDAFCIQN